MSEVGSHYEWVGGVIMAGWSSDPLGEQQAIAMMAWSLSQLPYTLKGMAVDRGESTYFIFFILLFLITIRGMSLTFVPLSKNIILCYTYLLYQRYKGKKNKDGDEKILNLLMNYHQRYNQTKNLWDIRIYIFINFSPLPFQQYITVTEKKSVRKHSK